MNAGEGGEGSIANRLRNELYLRGTRRLLHDRLMNGQGPNKTSNSKSTPVVAWASPSDNALGLPSTFKLDWASQGSARWGEMVIEQERGPGVTDLVPCLVSLD